MITTKSNQGFNLCLVFNLHIQKRNSLCGSQPSLRCPNTAFSPVGFFEKGWRVGKREFQIIRIVLVGNRKGMTIEPRKRGEGWLMSWICLLVWLFCWLFSPFFYVCVTRKRTRTRKDGEAERKGEVASDEKRALFSSWSIGVFLIYTNINSKLISHLRILKYLDLINDH